MYREPEVSEFDRQVLARALTYEAGKGPQTRAWDCWSVKAPAFHLRSMVARGLVRLEGKSRRITLYSLTPKGKEVAQEKKSGTA
jgi:hypothetical protein